MKRREKMKKVLVVDDEPSIVTLLTFNLEKEGYQVTTCNNGKDAVKIACSQTFDFILLDIMLPFLDGMEVTKQLRAKHIDTPILLLTAKDETIDKIIGLEIGADDYIAKPFSPREVIARMKAIQRRLTTVAPISCLKNGVITIYTKERSAFLKDKPLTLTQKEFDLLYYLMTHLNEALSRDQLLNEVWEAHFLGESRMVDIHISHLREKIEENPKQPHYIQTVRGIGYKMVKLDEK